jgi:hypothetical protein
MIKAFPYEVVMKKTVLINILGLLIVLGSSSYVCAQGVITHEPDPAVVRDPLMEKDSMHNLDVARQYFKVRKAYKAAFSRCEEILAGNPNFSKIDEVLYIAGISSLRLAENKGKQVSTDPVERLRKDAITYLSRLVEDFPESPFHEEAERELKTLGWVKKDSKK